MSQNTRPGGYEEQRFVAPLEASRRGAHRARVSPLVASLPVLAVVVVVIAVIAVAYTVLSSRSSDTSSTAGANLPPAAGQQQVSPSAAAGQPNAGGQPSPDPNGAQPSVDPNAGQPSTDPNAGQPSTDPAAGGPDKTVHMSVYNSSGINGLGKKVSAKLTGGGWTVAKTATWTGAKVAKTTVYYANESMKVSAEALVQELGTGVVKLSAGKAAGGLVVVLASDAKTLG